MKRKEKKRGAKKRQLQDSNLRGQSPTDFESVSLTTRTNCLVRTSNLSYLRDVRDREEERPRTYPSNTNTSRKKNTSGNEEEHDSQFSFVVSAVTVASSAAMSSLLAMDFEGRKRFVFEELRTVPQWSDVASVDDFCMEQNKGGGNFAALWSRWLDERDLQTVKEIEPGRLPHFVQDLRRGYPVCVSCLRVGSSEFLNREKELAFFSILSENHFGISLIRHFPEGRLEEWKVGYKVILWFVCHSVVAKRGGLSRSCRLEADCSQAGQYAQHENRGRSFRSLQWNDAVLGGFVREALRRSQRYLPGPQSPKPA